MDRASTFFAVLVLLAASGCSTWPEPGQGGAAEMRMPSMTVASHSIDPTLAQRLDCTLARAQAMQQAASDQSRLTGSAAVVGQTAVLAEREYAGFLHADTALTLDRLDGEIDRVAAALGNPAVIPPRCG